MDDKQLIKMAFEAKKTAYAPYSGFAVGAALLTAKGKVYKGCNIESAAYSPTNCAERTAFFKAVSEGVRDFTAIAVTGSHLYAGEKDLGWAYPCGVCRQVMMEFCDHDTFKILVARTENEYVIHTLNELLPHAFGPDNLK